MPDDIARPRGSWIARGLILSLVLLIAALLLTPRSVFTHGLLTAFTWVSPTARTDIDPETAALRVVWIGNSHSYGHQVPHQVQDLAEQHGHGPLYVEFIRAPSIDQGFTRLRAALAARDWDVVVLQDWSVHANYRPTQGLAAVDEAREILRDAGSDARILHVEGWRYLDRDTRRQSQEQIDTLFCGHQALGDEVAFVGWAFYLPHDDFTPLSADGNHTTAEGAALESEMIFARLFDTELPATDSPELPAQGPACEERVHLEKVREVEYDDGTRIVQRAWGRRDLETLISRGESGCSLEVTRPIDWVHLATSRRRSGVDPVGWWPDHRWKHDSIGTRPTPGVRDLDTSGPDRCGDIPTRLHRYQTRPYRTYTLLELPDIEVWFLGDLLSECPPIHAPDDVRRGATWFEDLAEAHPRGAFYGSDHPSQDADGLRQLASFYREFASMLEASDLEAYRDSPYRERAWRCGSSDTFGVLRP